ncbi:hypothetical protein ET475_11120 [Microbacterium protaetiae]|uniref:Asp23/Gls24 family envelope stress response protein n=1 Tax=Microbacterium protaetiae TaxID=2509458 RepID=A0A4P6EDY1_9MICO|nr:hypothetical protein [Microbacterium protaetiae]QAY60482.1 hypothetical protein ET475_11120 [Microbacterium protaetiae]
MTTEDSAVLAAAVEAAARAVTGVITLYRPGSLAANLLDAGAELLGRSPSLVAIDESGGELRVRVAIGVHAAQGAPQTVRAVHDAVRALLEPRHPDAQIEVTVVHIMDATA